MLCVVVLLDVESVILQKYTHSRTHQYLEFDDRSLVVVHVTVVRCTENRDNDREVAASVPPVHLVALKLCLKQSSARSTYFVSPDHRNQVVPRQELVCHLVPEEPAAPPHFVLFPSSLQIALVLFHWITPQQITKQSRSRRLVKSVDLPYVFQLSLFSGWGTYYRFKVRRNASMNRNKLPVDDAG